MKYFCKRCKQFTVEFQDEDEGYLCDPCGLFYDESELDDEGEGEGHGWDDLDF